MTRRAIQNYLPIPTGVNDLLPSFFSTGLVTIPARADIGSPELGATLFIFLMGLIGGWFLSWMVKRSEKDE